MNKVKEPQSGPVGVERLATSPRGSPFIPPLYNYPFATMLILLPLTSPPLIPLVRPCDRYTELVLGVLELAAG